MSMGRTIKQKKLKKVLIVDDEEDMIWTLQKNLTNDTLRAEIITASSGEKALEIIKNTPVDLIVTDIRMSGMSGIDLLIEVRNNYPNIGVIVMTAYPTTESKTKAIIKGSLYFLEKPFDINEMRDVVRHVLREDSLFKGTVAGVELTDIIQINSLSRSSTVLKVRAKNKEGIIFFREGSVVHAICGEFEGEEAFYEIMTFKGGVLEGTKAGGVPTVTIRRSVEALLIEGTRRLDEQRARHGDDQELEMDEAISPDDSEWKSDTTVMLSGVATKAERGSSAIRDDVSFFAGSHSGNDGSSHIQQIKDAEDSMEGLQKLLGEFTNIPGVNTACLVGRDGFLLDSKAIAGVDTEMIGAIASSGFGASEAMGRQLGKGPLAMTMLEYESGPVMLSPVGSEAFLVVVAERESNLGMIRLKIKRHSKEIQAAAAI